MKTFLYSLFIVLYAFIGCASKSANAEDARTKRTITIQRFDKDLLAVLNGADDKQLRANYPSLITALAQTVNTDGNTNDELAVLKDYFNHPMLRQLYEQTSSLYENVTLLEDALADVDSIARVELEGRKLPKLAMHVSGFKQNVIYVDGILSISIDKYMGEDFPMYKEFFSEKERRAMSNKNLIRDYTKAWVMSDIVPQEQEQRLLDKMVTEGKVLYALSILVPQYTEPELIDYSDSDIGWCITNEKNIWNQWVKKNLLFSTDNETIYDYMNGNTGEAGSPDKLGAWIGFQLVKKYATRSKKNLVDVLNTDASTLLKEAKYKP